MSAHEEYILDQMLVEARVMMMEGSLLELDPSQFSDCVTSLIERLREADKDAARYRWLLEQAWFQTESEWQLSIGETETEEEFIIGASEKIDQAMKEKGDE
ncbi:MAG: hypothetical protein ACRCXB_34265 [Aeromonadaceae bacterium]